MESDLLVSNYDYDLPEELIAKYPITPRDEAKLLVYDRKKDKIIHTKFKNILDFVGDKRFIFNDTKVIKARIFGKKESGGRVELLLNRPFNNDFLVYIRGKVKRGTKLFFDRGLVAEVKELLEDGSRVVDFKLRMEYGEWKILDFYELVNILEEIGHIPLPPYIKRKDEEIDEKEYQTIFAKKEGAVAAPTASLHFTKNLLDKIEKKAYLTLHVGAGTFKPVEVEDIRFHKMHSEFFEIPKNTAEILDSNEEIVAVGTTATRTIEYYARTKKLKGECGLFLNPLNPPIRVNHLITNFHLPKSTLIMLVASFIGRKKTLEIYEIAKKEKYRFYSYGDAMLII
ncbi:tRNA preQ1(34) S-adenosylmethionine ribosyltransferase-isomerase QueA [Caminibacter mediatlanticus]|uniref:S-adenosylmethionine:tRNA ribosyltransferase-isomerase n=1 Tax=Caminibacter mediatlanticus TB-2 TaxID=391592 RepID=A0AAI9F308_9BACT|nr:tRNA preQ1(34) S-adenosylmethionine ribosyltransferase-isomerase QueA [Caminibacter mediatlanticus]EDM24364.1 S-adenosylmethionine:tRNA ribosyltransferase-isomerase [Caminibacter mediatlanticus TB-2]